MNTIAFYDNQNLCGRVLIWVHDNNTCETFTVTHTNPGLITMYVSGYPLFEYRRHNYFFKTGADMPKIYILKKEYV